MWKSRPRKAKAKAIKTQEQSEEFLQTSTPNSRMHNGSIAHGPCQNCKRAITPRATTLFVQHVRPMKRYKSAELTESKNLMTEDPTPQKRKN
mmetsp:Transcript_117789/g.184054  ORF Transcript_117789/g.184054 Transcript_117789/m.184054 type:complete len:92 (-) Transcript_117789:1349-1624(-)